MMRSSRSLNLHAFAWFVRRVMKSSLDSSSFWRMRWKVSLSTRKLDLGSTCASNFSQTFSGFLASSPSSPQLLYMWTPSSPVISKIYETCFSVLMSLQSKYIRAFCLKSLYAAVLSAMDQSMLGALMSPLMLKLSLLLIKINWCVVNAVFKISPDHIN